MKRCLAAAALIILAVSAADARPAPPIFKQRKYFGPIPYNSISIGIGFIDGPTAENFANYLNKFAVDRRGTDMLDAIDTSPFFKIAYERQLTPNHFLKTSLCFSYLKTDNNENGYYVAELDSATEILAERTFKVFLFSLDVGFSYSFISPEVHRLAPYIGGGFSSVFPIAQLDTKNYELIRLDAKNYIKGQEIPNPAENISRSSMEAGLHAEFGMMYYITNNYSASIEGRYQMAQSRFYFHDFNFVIDLAGFSLGMNFYRHF